MFKKFVLAFIFSILSFSANAQLSLSDEPPKVKAQLVAENDGIVAGKPFWVALRQEIEPGWHTYWKNPGDTGLATKVTWDLPDGFTVGELAFPTPHRQRMSGMVNYGYENAVMILAEITPPATLKNGSKIELKGKASWLVCQEICIPEDAQVSVTLPVVKNPNPSLWANAFIATRHHLPATHKAKQAAKITEDAVTLTINPLPLPSSELPEEAYFFPDDGLLIQHAAEQKMELDRRSLTLTIPKNTTRTEAIETISGDVWVRTSNGERSFRFETKAEVEKKTPMIAAKAGIEGDAGQPGIVGLDNGSRPAPGNAEQGIGFFTAIFTALLGGILLNLMPCVFPVLSLKALGLVHKSHHEDRAEVVKGGIAYLGGVLASFTLLGLVLIGLKSAGSQIGWGVQLQSPVFVAALAVLLFFIGYVLSGAITIGTSFMRFGDALTRRSGHAGAFFTGALAVVVATPCTAPFMGGAVFYALTHNWFVTLLVLWALGLGLALPYVLLTLYPQTLLKYLPKPGIWMEYFKQFLAFPMLAASIWLVWVLGQQNGATGVLYVLSSMLLIAFGFWLWDTAANRPATTWQKVKKIMAVLAGFFALLLIFNQPQTEIALPADTAVHEVFTPEKLVKYRNEGQPVFVNMTAAWCITCLANEKTALSTDAVQQFFASYNVRYLKGDWTNRDPAITSYLREFNRSGVPIYVFYPAGKATTPVLLPQLLTPKTVIQTLQPHIQG